MVTPGADSGKKVRHKLSQLFVNLRKSGLVLPSCVAVWQSLLNVELRSRHFLVQTFAVGWTFLSLHTLVTMEKSCRLSRLAENVVRSAYLV